ncbi:MAG TPA: acetylxylan esterase [Candidatus Acidoferrum sp.]|nr:acetylxylan esterase [Candidatus Acidoferrum sp.]
MRHFVTTLLVAGCFTVSALHAQPAPTAEQLAELQQQTDTATKVLQGYLNQLGYRQLQQREQTIAAITTQQQAIQRQQSVKQRITQLVDGIPATQGKLSVKTFGRVQDAGFRVEKLMYESARDYWVTADVYVPDGRGPFPALVIAPGHGAGKSSSHSWAANFALRGYVVLSIDPMGQGERMQHWDAELGNSKVEPSGEHEHANQSALLLGRLIARYWFADGIRGVDYLNGRSDVDGQRIGTFGCSGGGTAAAYLAAMDPRIKAAAVASFITSFKELLPGNGPQDAEQTLPGFIANGFDFADWVELAAPRPLAIAAFKQDFFPYAGAEQTYAEASRFYELFNAKDQLQFIGGEGGHCNLAPVMPQVVGFLDRYLKPSDASPAAFTAITPKDADALLVTPTGQLATSTDSKTVEALLRADASKLEAKHAVIKNTAALATLQQRLRTDIRQLAGVTATTDEHPPSAIIKKEQRNGFGLFTMTLHTDDGVELPALLGVPSNGGVHPLLVRMEATPIGRTASSMEFEQQVQAGNIVALFQPRGVLGDTPTTQLALGQYMPNLLRAIVVNKTLVGLRVDDTLRLFDVLLARPDVSKDNVTLYASGALGLVALHTAALDERIARLITENMLVSYQAALDAGLHKNLSESVIPGVLHHYDTIELLQSLAPRKALLLNPANAMGQRMTTADAEQALAVVLDTAKALDQPGLVQLGRRNPREPLPLGR